MDYYSQELKYFFGNLQKLLTIKRRSTELWFCIYTVGTHY